MVRVTRLPHVYPAHHHADLVAWMADQLAARLGTPVDPRFLVREPNWVMPLSFELDLFDWWTLVPARRGAVSELQRRLIVAVRPDLPLLRTVGQRDPWPGRKGAESTTTSRSPAVGRTGGSTWCWCQACNCAKRDGLWSPGWRGYVVAQPAAMLSLFGCHGQQRIIQCDGTSPCANVASGVGGTRLHCHRGGGDAQRHLSALANRAV